MSRLLLFLFIPAERANGTVACVPGSSDVKFPEKNVSRLFVYRWTKKAFCVPVDKKTELSDARQRLAGGVGRRKAGGSVVRIKRVSETDSGARKKLAHHSNDKDLQSYRVLKKGVWTLLALPPFFSAPHLTSPSVPQTPNPEP